MIKLNKLNKYFYKGEARQIHVINNCTIDLPDTGLVTFLGTSGSGKTTLLNVIGGLDKVESGSITYGNNTFTNNDRKEIDEYRKNNIGYIFQNYLLFNEKSVYNNLKEALELIGVYDQEEQRKRIEYALEKVNMYKFRRKRVKNLSGGQMQRVSIARALVKDAKIIIADEPTGNIDSANTIEVMNILKKLSETTLVILVTHEESIANYYSDRIINIKDGQIIGDNLVTERKKLSSETDQKIYLLDYEKESSESEKLDVDLYYDDKATKSSVQIIIKNNTIYIKSDKKIINLNESSISLVNENYQDYEANVKLTNEETFDTSWFKKDVTKQNPFVSFFKNLGKGFVDYFSGKKSYIFFMIIFIILGAITATSAINLVKYTSYDDSNVFDEDGYYFVVENELIEKNNYSSYSPYIENVDVVRKAYTDGIINEYLYINNNYSSFVINQSIIDKDSFTVKFYYYPYEDMVLECGNAPRDYEVVIGKKLADTIIEGLNLTKGNYEYLIGLTVGIYTCSGVSARNTNVLYVDIDNISNTGISISNYSYYKYLYYDGAYLVGNYEYNKANIQVTSGRAVESQYEIMLDESAIEQFELGTSFTYKVGEKENKDITYTIVGFYKSTSTDGFGALAMDNEIIGRMFYSPGAFTERDSYYDVSVVNDSQYVLVSGSKPANLYEVLANVNSGYNVGDVITETGYSSTTYKVTGLYDLTEETKKDGYYTLMADRLLTHPCLSEYDFQYCAYKLDGEKLELAKQYFEDNGFTLMSVKDYQQEAVKQEYTSEKILNIILTLFLIALVILFTYLTSRSKMIREIYSIGVYRSLGQSKKDIKKKAIYISIAQTTTSSLIGYALVIGIYLYFGMNYVDIFEDFSTKPALLLLGIPVLYFINIVFSLIPYNTLLRKTPSEINSKFDI